MGWRAATRASGKATGGLFSWLGWFMKLSLIMFLAYVLLFQSVMKGIEQKSVSVVFIDIAERFGMATKELNDESQKIIDQQGVYDAKKGFFGKVGTGLGSLLGIFSALLLVFLWVRVLAKIISHSPFSNTSATFVNYGAAIIVFMFLQMVLVVSIAAVRGDITTYIAERDSVSYYLSLPWRSFATLYKALPYFVSPISKVAENVV